MLTEPCVWEARPSFCWRGCWSSSRLTGRLSGWYGHMHKPKILRFYTASRRSFYFNPNAFYLNLDLVENRCSLYKKAFKSAQC